MGKHWRRDALRCSAVVLAVSVVVSVASGSAAATEASAVPATLVGTWSRNVTQANWRKYGEYADPSGVWTFVITKGGEVSLFHPGNGCSASPDVATQFAASPTSLTFGPELACPSKGTYGWKLSGRSLTLKLIADEKCPFRIALLTTGVWKRK